MCTVLNPHSIPHCRAQPTHPVHNLNALQRQLHHMVNPCWNEHHPPRHFCPSFQLHTTPKTSIPAPLLAQGFHILLTIRAGQTSAGLPPLIAQRSAALLNSSGPPHLCQDEYVEGEIHQPAGGAVRQDHSAVDPDPGGHDNHQLVRRSPGSLRCSVYSTRGRLRRRSVFRDGHLYSLPWCCVSARLHCSSHGHKQHRPKCFPATNPPLRELPGCRRISGRQTGGPETLRGRKGSRRACGCGDF